MSCTPSQIFLIGGLTDVRIKQTYVVVQFSNSHSS